MVNDSMMESMDFVKKKRKIIEKKNTKNALLGDELVKIFHGILKKKKKRIRKMLF